MTEMNRCTVCGKLYNYCPNCKKYHSWKFYTDTAEHYQIHIILDNYRSKIYTKEDAVKAFEHFGIVSESDLSYMLPEVEKDVREIIGEKRQSKKNKTEKE